MTGRSLEGYRKALGYPDSDAALLALARAVAASPAWVTAPDAVLMARTSPEPLLAVMGHFDAGQAAWIGVQARALDASCGRLRYADYTRVEEGCDRLAALLVDRLGRDRIRRARFGAIPRGGLVPLGLLATVLGLDRGQLEPPHPPDLPLIVVDDCALSGSRFRAFLDRHPKHRRIVFAHLYSHPECRAKIAAEESRVVACLSAWDLDSVTGSEEPAARRARFLELLDGAFWIGDTEPLGFPWGEPDRMIWHPVEQRPALAWCVVPPELSLKSRVRPSIPIEEQPEPAGPLRPQRDVIFGKLAGHMVLHNLSQKQSAVLDDVASDIWTAVVRHGSVRRAAEALCLEYRVSAEVLRRDAAHFVARLTDQGFLQSEEPFALQAAL